MTQDIGLFRALPPAAATLRADSWQVTLQALTDRDTLEREWRALEQVSQASFFLRWAWVGALLNSADGIDPPQVLRVHLGAQTKGLALLWSSRQKRHGFVRTRSLHLQETGRLAFDRMDDAQRQELISATGVRLAEVMEQNILDFNEGERDPEYDYQDGYIELLNKRMVDYSEFAEFTLPNGKPNFQPARFLSLMIREDMEKTDQSWIQDQLMDIEVPAMMEMAKKNMDGFYPPTNVD